MCYLSEHTIKRTVLPITTLLFFITTYIGYAESQEDKIEFKTDPITRYIHITYPVPDDAPNEVVILCFWSNPGEKKWQPAKVIPYISETALRFITEDEWNEWIFNGKIKEYNANGLKRTLIFNPYPEVQKEGRVNINFRIQIQSNDGKVLSTQQTLIQVDNSDVVYLEDWSQVLQKECIVLDTSETGDRTWSYANNLDPTNVTYGNALIGKQWRKDLPLPQLTYSLNLTGKYAIFVCTPKNYSINLRLSGDERTELLWSPKPFQETLWRWTDLTRQHLIIKQPHYYTGYIEGKLDYIKLVPLPSELIEKLENRFDTPDKIIAGYFEPYSWAFFEDIQESVQHREPLIAYKEARISIVDTQVGRFGAKVVYESHLTDQLIYSTIGDPIAGVVPTTDNVGKMQQFTNTLKNELQFAKELGLTLHANFGATNCYPNSPLQSDFSKNHPDWMRGGVLRYEIPEVQNYILSLIKETLEIGAEGISIDFCRYPEGIDKPETCTQFLHQLKKLRQEFSLIHNKPIPLLIRFPAQGVRHWENFDYKTWIKEELVDYLCPSNIQGRHMHFDITPYVNTVKGTSCKLLPVIDGLSWGPELPGPFLWRVQQLYETGADGIYIYQADSRICLHNKPADRHCIRLITSSQAVNNWWKQYKEQNTQFSKRIYIQPSEDGDYEYHPWERCGIWIEGIEPHEVEIYLDDKLINRYSHPPYIVGGEDYQFDNLITKGEHTLHIRAKDNNQLLQQTFQIQGAT